MTENSQTKEKRSKERVAYGLKLPSLSLQEAIQIIKETVRLGGLSGSINALGKATGNSTGSSNFDYKISALKNFGLITVQNEDIYTLTEIGKRIVQPQSPDEEVSAIVEAFSKNNVLNRIWENYKGKILPQKEYLANYICKSLDISNELSQGWAAYFYDATGYAQLLDERKSGSFQVLSEPLFIKNLDVSTEKPNDSINPELKSTIPPLRNEPPKNSQGYASLMTPTDEGQWGTFVQKRISGGRKAVFAIPDELTQQEIDSLRNTLKGIDSMLDGLKKDE